MQTPNFTILYVDQPRQSASRYTQLFKVSPVEVSDTFALFVFPNGSKLGLWSKHTVEPAATPVGGAEVAICCDSEASLAQHFEHATGLDFSLTQGITVMDFGHTFVLTDPDGHRLRYYWPCESV